MNRQFIVCLASCALAVLSGCNSTEPEDNSNSAPEPLTCTSTDTEVERDEVTDLGFSADDVLAPLEGTYQAVLQLRDGGTTDLTITAGHDGSPIVVREWAPPAEDPDLECPGQSLVVKVAVTFTTADGAFAESWTQVLDQEQLVPLSTLSANLATADLEGTWDPEDATTLSFWVNVAHDDGDASTYGELVSVVEVPDEGPTECGFASWNIEPQTGCQ
jgi:hypothetical protein